MGVTSTISSSAMNSIACSRFSHERHQANRFVGGGRTHVGQLLLAHHVHVQIVVAGVLADDHALVDLDARTNEQIAAVLQSFQCIRRGQPARSAIRVPVGRCGISPCHSM